MSRSPQEARSEFLILTTTELVPMEWTHLIDDRPVHAFNPAIARWDDGWIMAYRICFADRRRRIALCRLDDQFRVRAGVVPFSDLVLSIDGSVAEWFADPRLFTHDGTTFVYWNSGVGSGRNRQYACAIDRDTLRPEAPIFGVIAPGIDRPVEKNWGFFSRDGLYCVYSYEPFRVLRARVEGASIVCADVDPRFAGRDQPGFSEAFRGGASPCAQGDAFFAFGHSLHHGPVGAIYAPEVMVFSQRSPFTPVARNRDELPLPNPKGATFTLPKLNPAVASVVYPAGAAYHDGRWIVSYGINDECCAIAKIPEARLMAALRPIDGDGAQRRSGSIARFEPAKSWLDDPYWVNAAKWVLDLSRRYAHVLAPAEFNNLSDRCLPLSYAHALPMKDVAIVLPKDDCDRLPLDWLRNLEGWAPLFADEVFVGLAAGLSEPSMAVPEEQRAHLGYLWDKVAAVLRHRPVRRSEIDDGLSIGDTAGSYGVIICAAKTRNAGDRLIAGVLAGLLSELAPDRSWVVAGADIDRTLISNASTVVLGPGGFFYDACETDDHVADLNNLANYGRVGYLAGEYGKPLLCIGVGAQHIRSETSTRFLASALRHARLVVTREQEFTQVLSDLLGDVEVTTFPDLSVLWSKRVAARRAAILGGTGARPGIVVCGHFDPEFSRALFDSLDANRGRSPVEVTVVMQAMEDADWYFKMRGQHSMLRSATAIDLRDGGADDLIDALAGADAVITSRFHGMMVGAMAGGSLLVVARPGDKKARAVNTLSNGSGITLIDPAGASDIAGTLRDFFSRAKGADCHPAVVANGEVDRLRGLLRAALR